MTTMSPEIVTPEVLPGNAWPGFEPAHNLVSDLSNSHEILQIRRSEDDSTEDFYLISSDGGDGSLGEIDERVRVKRQRIYDYVQGISKLDALLTPGIVPLERKKVTGDWEPPIEPTEFDEEQLALGALMEIAGNDSMRSPIIHKLIDESRAMDRKALLKLNIMNRDLQRDRSLSVALRKVDPDSPNEFQTVARLVGFGALRCVPDPKLPPIHYVRPVLIVENKFKLPRLQPPDGAVIGVYHRQGQPRVDRKEEIEES